MGESSREIAKGLASQQFVSALDAWRAAHPKATMREIEIAVDEELAAVRAEMVGELAQRSPLRDIAGLAEDERPRCEQCRLPLISRGTRPRRLKGPRDREVVLERSYGVCPRCELGLFPPR